LHKNPLKWGILTNYSSALAIKQEGIGHLEFLPRSIRPSLNIGRRILKNEKSVKKHQPF